MTEKNSEVDKFLNFHAESVFRDMADQDYIAARFAYRANLYNLFFWNSLQAIEKYLKCILLINRVNLKSIKDEKNRQNDEIKEFEKNREEAHGQHCLRILLDLVVGIKKLQIEISEGSKEFINYLDSLSSHIRYSERSFIVEFDDLFVLDKVVWEIRRYARILDDKENNINLEFELQKNKDAEKNPRTFNIENGYLEKVICNKKYNSVARTVLICQNIAFGKSKIENIGLKFAHPKIQNSPFGAMPSLDALLEIEKYVHISKYYKDEIRNP